MRAILVDRPRAGRRRRRRLPRGGPRQRARAAAATRSCSTTRSASSTGADLKVAGVRAGTIKGLDVDPKTHKALVDFEITAGGLRLAAQGRLLRVAPAVADRRVLHRLQARHLAREARRTARRSRSSRRRRRSPSTSSTTSCASPYRERLGIILDELGAGVAGRAEDINDVVRRASPALRETDHVLAKLATQNQTLKQLDHRRGHRDRRPRRQQARTSAAGSSRPRRPPPPPPSAAPTSPPACSACPPSCASCARRWPSSATPPRPRRPRCRTSTRPPTSSRRSWRTSSRCRSPPRSTCARWPRPRARAARPSRPRSRSSPSSTRRPAQGAGARQQLRDRARAPQRPQERRREGPALTGRPGLHGLRGGPAVGLRPVAGDQHLRQERLHAEGQPLPLEVLATTRTRSR